jgi:hypothetical protein
MAPHFASMGLRSGADQGGGRAAEPGGATGAVYSAWGPQLPIAAHACGAEALAIAVAEAMVARGSCAAGRIDAKREVPGAVGRACAGGSLASRGAHVPPVDLRALQRHLAVGLGHASVALGALGGAASVVDAEKPALAVGGTSTRSSLAPGSAHAHSREDSALQRWLAVVLGGARASVRTGTARAHEGSRSDGANTAHAARAAVSRRREHRTLIVGVAWSSAPPGCTDGRGPASAEAQTLGHHDASARLAIRVCEARRAPRARDALSGHGVRRDETPVGKRRLLAVRV